jgi:hydroxymethylpyrimidine/phosphomethylpyrimidine kinase
MKAAEKSSRLVDAPYVVAVAGLDPGGGAGLLRDALTVRSLGARAALVGTAWTIQGPGGVAGVEPRSAEGVRQAFAHALGGGDPEGTAVKIGMVPNGDVAAAIVAALDDGPGRRFPGPVVWDPVLGASHGGRLFRGDVDELWPLLRRATLVTPNLSEAAALLGQPVRDRDEARAAARALRARGCAAVLVKGGHLDGAAEDVLASADGERSFVADRVPGPSPRGTGCALASAIAVGLAEGRTLEYAIERAKVWLSARIAGAHEVAGERRLE